MKKYSAEEKKKIEKLMLRLVAKQTVHNLPYRRLGLLFGVSGSLVWKWVNGDTYPSESHLFYIRSFLKDLK